MGVGLFSWLASSEKGEQKPLAEKPLWNMYVIIKIFTVMPVELRQKMAKIGGRVVQSVRGNGPCGVPKSQVFQQYLIVMLQNSF